MASSRHAVFKRSAALVVFTQQQHQLNLCGISHSFWSRLDEVDADPPRSYDITNLAEAVGRQLAILPLPPLIYK